MHLMKMCSPQTWLCLFTFRPIASKQLNSLTTIITLSWLGGAVVTHPLWVGEVPGSIPGSGKDFYIWFFVLFLLRFYFLLSKNRLFVTTFCNFFCKICDRLWGYKYTDLVSLNLTKTVEKGRSSFKIDFQNWILTWPPIVICNPGALF